MSIKNRTIEGREEIIIYTIPKKKLLVSLREKKPEVDEGVEKLFS